MTPPTREPEVVRRYSRLPDGTMHESVHGDWVRYPTLRRAMAERDAAVRRRREIDDEAFEYAEQTESLKARLAACVETLALVSVALPDFKWAAWLLLHAAKQGVNEHRSMMDSQSVITQHIERIEPKLRAAVAAETQGEKDA